MNEWDLIYKSSQWGGFGPWAWFADLCFKFPTRSFSLFSKIAPLFCPSSAKKDGKNKNGNIGACTKKQHSAVLSTLLELIKFNFILTTLKVRFCDCPPWDRWGARLRAVKWLAPCHMGRAGKGQSGDQKPGLAAAEAHVLRAWCKSLSRWTQSGVLRYPPTW